MTDQERIVAPVSVEALEKLLRCHGVEVDMFGTGSAKTLKHLLRELKEGECFFTIENGVLTRYVRVVSLRIIRPDGKALKEVFQLFHEGLRIRKRTLDGSTGEKIKADESPQEAVRRLIEEEFSLLLLAMEDIEEIKVVISDKVQPSYPGLRSVYEIHFFQILFDLGAKLPEVEILVIEADGGLSAGYVWVTPWWEDK